MQLTMGSEATLSPRPSPLPPAMLPTPSITTHRDLNVKFVVKWYKQKYVEWKFYLYHHTCIYICCTGVI